AGGFYLYPSPGDGTFTVDYSLTLPATLRLINISGQLVYEKELVGNKTSVDARHLSPGIYTAVIESTASSSRRLFIRE
ncbi:MAG: T9SS type A sorting domain-containing protein, partial [Bacteroidetes bacterium]|nr:T9SS type A sorting domain-containing protein [Bacteroidota bacterium]